MRHLRALLLSLGLTIAFGAHAELRTYEVDARYRQEVYAALRSVLNPNEQVSSGRISLLPTGQLLIDTSPEMHEQVAKVLESINNYHVEATPRVTLRYWTVIGTRNPALESAIGQGAEVPEILAGVLEELRRVHGDLSFRLYGNATLVSASGQRGELNGETLNIMQLAYVQPSVLNAELAIRFSYNVLAEVTASTDGGRGGNNAPRILGRVQQSVELHTSLEPKEFVVVGENTIRNSDRMTDGIDGTVFYIVQWDVAE